MYPPGRTAANIGFGWPGFKSADGWRSALRPFYHVWMLLAAVLGYVNTHILLAVIFYTMFTVTGLVMRAFGRDPLRLKAFGRRRTDPHHPKGDGADERMAVLPLRPQI